MNEVNLIALPPIDRLEASIALVFTRASAELRRAVTDFNATPPTLQSIDEFRTRVLGIAAALDADNLARR